MVAMNPQNETLRQQVDRIADKYEARRRMRSRNRPEPPDYRDMLLPWHEFYDKMDWQQGEHVSIIGPTGLGKTFLMIQLLPKRKYVCAFATKPKDSTMDELVNSGQGFQIVRGWPPSYGMERVILWPKITHISDRMKAKDTFERALKTIFVQGGWTIAMDEMLYVAKYLKLTQIVEEIYLQGRSLHISLVGAVQRPKQVTLLMYDQATHLFFFKDNDENNLTRIGGIGWINSRLIKAIVARLPQRHFLYINSRTGEMHVSIAER